MATSSDAPDGFPALGRALSMLVGETDRVEPHRLIELIDRCSVALGANGASVWLVDHQQRALVCVATDDAREQVPVDGSMAGRAFSTSEVAQVDEGNRSHLWVPLLIGVDRIGVLEVTIDDEPDIARWKDFAAVVATEIVASSHYTDHFTRARRQQPMTLAAELQWASLPPLSFATEAVQVAGIVEPAYEVGGDAFDYAHSDGLLSFAIFDAVGHTLESSVISSLALGAYRNGRRHERGLAETAGAIDDVIRDHLGGGRFATGQLAVLDTTDGRLEWLNAGHPLPLLIRDGRVIGHLECTPRPPFGLDDLLGGRGFEIAIAQLQPGDAVLLYSDGVVERGSATGVDYGIDRLKDFLQNAFAAQMSPAETLRRLSTTVHDFHEGQLADDATTMLVIWDGHRTTN